MEKVGRIIAMASLLTTLSVSASAEVDRLGLYNSPKGFGLKMENVLDERQSNTLTLYADIDGLILDNEKWPGVKLSYSHNHFFKKGNLPEAEYAFYVGAGASAGWVRDFSRETARHKGICACLETSIGVLFTFSGHIDLALDFTLEAGLHFRKEELYGNPAVSWYANGVFKTPLPQLTIFYRF